MARHRIRSGAAAGFTLIELLLVMLILALTISIVALNAPRGRPTVQLDAERFAAMMQRATREAIMTGKPLRLEVSAGGYRYLQFSAEGWLPAAAGPALAASFEKSTNIEIELGDSVFANTGALGGAKEPNEGTYSVSIDPAGTVTPITIQFSSRRGVWIVRLSAEGDIVVQRGEV